MDASCDGQVEMVEALLKNNPGLDVNFDSQQGWTALHFACVNGHTSVVKLLLAHPAINVNARNDLGRTPLSSAAGNGHPSVVQLLLQDPRVDTSLVDEASHPPLWHASHWGHFKVIEGLIASGRDLGDLLKVGKHSVYGKEHTILELARKQAGADLVLLLERFMVNPARTRHEILKKLGLRDEMASEIFALTVFLCDGLLQIKLAVVASDPTATATAAATTTTAAAAVAAAATRFFEMATRLPMELQMILARRAVGSMRQHISSNGSEVAFKSLATILLVSQE